MDLQKIKALRKLMIPILKPNFKTVKFHREIYVNQKIIIVF